MSSHYRVRNAHFSPTAKARAAASACIVLVCGPRVPDSIVVSHMAAVLNADRRLALVLLREPSREVTRFIQQIQHWRGTTVAWQIVHHSDWIRIPRRPSLAVLSSAGFYLDDQKICQIEHTHDLSPDDLATIYSRRTNAGVITL